MNWTELLRMANIPEPPGYRQTVERVTAKPKPPKGKKKAKSKAKRKR